MDGFYVGDIIGNSYTHENEVYNLKTKDFELFTDRCKFSDDTILSFATMDWLLNTDHTLENMLKIIREYYKRFPDKEPTIYGPEFAKWAEEGCKSSRKSFGNGGAMRCSPIGWYANSLEEIDDLVEKGISATHNTDLGRQGAKIVCYCIYFLRHQHTLEDLKNFITNTFNMDLDVDFEQYRREYKYTSDAKETIRPAILSLLYSHDFEDGIRNAISFGGDTDTITTIYCAIAEAFYNVIPKELLIKCKSYLPNEFKTLLDKFNNHLSK